jgi:tripartite-type tricarboxylate transporter receptor subunit TctC
MHLARRKILRLAAGAALLSPVSRTVLALDYPTRPVHLLAGFPPGGIIDIIARLIGQWLSERLGQSFVIENRVGGGSNIATELVARAAPDGYTLLLANAVNSWNTTLYNHLNFDFSRDIAPVASISRGGSVMEVNPSFPAKTVPEFIAYAKANPGKINTAGIDVMFDPVVSSIGYIRAGKLRPLGVITATRLDILPDVPPIGDFVPGYEGSGWQGIGAPANTPPEIISILNREVNAALADATFKARLVDLGAEPFTSSPAKFGKFIADYTEKWRKLIRTSGIKVE